MGAGRQHEQKDREREGGERERERREHLGLEGSDDTKCRRWAAKKPLDGATATKDES